MAVTIFVVDSDISMSEEVAAVLSHAGYQPFRFANPSEALDALDAGAIVDVVVTKLNFPGNVPQGAALALAAKRISLAVKVIFLGSKDMQPYLEDVGTLVPLPATSARIVDAVRSALTDR